LLDIPAGLLLEVSMNENVAIGAICALLLAASIGGGVADLRLSAKAERLMNAATVLTQPACEPPTVALTYNDPSCASKPHRTMAYYRVRMDALAQN
jgi:hypothetical protein